MCNSIQQINQTSLNRCVQILIVYFFSSCSVTQTKGRTARTSLWPHFHDHDHDSTVVLEQSMLRCFIVSQFSFFWFLSLCLSFLLSFIFFCRSFFISFLSTHPHTLFFYRPRLLIVKDSGHKMRINLKQSRPKICIDYIARLLLYFYVICIA